MSSDTLLNSNDIQRLLDACEESRDKALLLVLLDTGMKLGEVEKLTLADIKWTEKQIKIPKRRGVYGPVSEFTLDVLKDWVSSRPPASHKGVFVSLKGEPEALSSRGIDHILRTLGDKAGIGKVSARRLRNMFLNEQGTEAETEIKTTPERLDVEGKPQLSCPKKCKWVLGFLGFSFILGTLFYLFLREED